MTDGKTEAGVIADLAVKAAGLPTNLTGADKREWLILPDGMKATDISDAHGPAARRPPYVRQTVTLQAVDSLIMYVNRFRNEATVLFADIAGSSIRAVIDYHRTPEGLEPPAAERGAHLATMTLPFSEEWQIWTNVDGQLMGQLEFARFLEENGADVTAPDGATLLEVCRDLQAVRAANFIKAIRTASDNENFEYTDKTELSSRGGIEVPTKFRLYLPVYFGEAASGLNAFLRHKLDPEKGNLLLGIKLHRAEHVRQAVFKEIVLRVGDGTGCPVVFGKVA